MIDLNAKINRVIISMKYEQQKQQQQKTYV